MTGHLGTTGLVFVAVLLAVLAATTPARRRVGPGPTSGSRTHQGVLSRIGLGDGRQGPEDAALLLDLIAAAGQAGMPVPSALIAAGRAGGGHLGEGLVRVGTAVLLGADLTEAWQHGAPVDGRPHAPDRAAADLDVIRDQVLLVQACGAPGGALLHAAADGVRRRRRRRREAAAAALSVRLVLPMGLCALPAFLALSVVPVVLSMLDGVLG